ncbi:pectate lyase domain-containing protein [Rhizoctonia solani AG-1 IA]|uniref:Pectate lyase domain-containing protein n=1 Tax=Thanatephorus cucumeris (strain AG1-IA) TaxID=983506 RepID=L8WI57_THACA|nr:pectate lyase domain-containing protein [Rhizoctonia solani AG-1 IA]
MMDFAGSRIREEQTIIRLLSKLPCHMTIGSFHLLVCRSEDSELSKARVPKMQVQTSDQGQTFYAIQVAGSSYVAGSGNWEELGSGSLANMVTSEVYRQFTDCLLRSCEDRCSCGLISCLVPPDGAASREVDYCLYKLIGVLAIGTPFGYGAGTTGGEGSTAAVPSSTDELISWLGDDTARVIVIDKTFDFTSTEGTVTGDGCIPWTCTPGAQIAINLNSWCDNDQPNAATQTNTDKLITSICRNSKGKGLRIAGSSNIIIQNVRFSDINAEYVWGGDAIAIDGGKNIWANVGRQFLVTVSDEMDVRRLGPHSGPRSNMNRAMGLRKASQFLIMYLMETGHHYWTLYFTGASDTITFARNYGRGPKLGGVSSYSPLTFCSYFVDITDHALDAGPGSKAIVEGNYFNTVVRPSTDGNTGQVFAPIDTTTSAQCTSALGRSCVANIILAISQLPLLQPQSMRGCSNSNRDHIRLTLYSMTFWPSRSGVVDNCLMGPCSHFFLTTQGLTLTAPRALSGVNTFLRSSHRIRGEMRRNRACEIIANNYRPLDCCHDALGITVCRRPSCNLWALGTIGSCSGTTGLSTLEPVVRCALEHPPFIDPNATPFIPISVYRRRRPVLYKVRGVPLYQMDRQRLSKLNRTIRHLDASFSTSKSLFEGYNPDIPRLLLDLCELDTSLFPRLLSLNTECRSDAEVLGILPLLTPSLRSLHIVIHQSATDYMHELLEGVESNLPNLKRLSISYRQTPSSISGQHEAEDGLAHRETDPYLYLPIQSLCLPRSLRCLSVPSTCASADALFNFSCLPHLDSLEFTGSWESDVYEGEWSELPSSSFSALAQLSLPDCSTRIASTLLTIIPGTAPLSKVAITLSGTDSGLRELCAALARFCNTIRGISINGFCLHSNPVHLQEIAEALTSCSKLEKLGFYMSAASNLRSAHWRVVRNFEDGRTHIQ